MYSKNIVTLKCDKYFNILHSSQEDFNVYNSLFDINESNNECLFECLEYFKNGNLYYFLDLFIGTFLVKSFLSVNGEFINCFLCFDDLSSVSSMVCNSNMFYKNTQIPTMELISSIDVISKIAEEKEDYNLIEMLKRMANNCYKILRSNYYLTEYISLINKTDIIKPESYILNNTLRDIFNSCKLLLSGNGYTFNFEICDELIIVDSDMSYLSKCIFMIISNSCKFSVKDMPIKASLTKIQNNAVISIIDQGDGLDVDNINKAFFPFYSSDDSMGLGLTICKIIIERLNGNIIITHGKIGTTVTITLPISNFENIKLNSYKRKYLSNRYSDMRIILSDICDINL
ncbi:MAG: sensor histidine kinase [Oscillospiraceae bacterium]